MTPMVRSDLRMHSENQKVGEVRGGCEAAE
jgi:hypothetical protein